MDILTNSHFLSSDLIMRTLETSSEGLTEVEAQRRLGVYGKNLIEEEKVSKITLFLRQFKNILIYVLILASIFSLVAGSLVDFFTICLLVIINSFVGFWQEVKAQVSIQALKKLTETHAWVIRDGIKKNISSSELVPGDCVILQEGEKVSADIRLFESLGLQVDESTLTGESVPVYKDAKAAVPADAPPFDMKNMLLAGTAVSRGVGKGVVTRTAGDTYLATIVTKGEQSPDTPLTKAVAFFAKRYLYFLVIIISLVGFYGFMQGRSLIDVVYISVALLVSAVPEGLPIVVTLVMVVGALALSKKKTFIRYLPSVETLGSATVIASDKTGTITEGNFAVTEIYAMDKQQLVLAAALCNDIHVGNQFDPIDKALYDWVPDGDHLYKSHPRLWSYPFDATLRMMASAHEVEGEEVLFVKGAYEEVKLLAIQSQDLSIFDKQLVKMSESGLRVLSFGRGKWENVHDPKQWKVTMVGLIGFLDPAKRGVKQAVKEAKRAGIRVIMLTGDHPLTARAIAKDIGIWKEGDGILTGREIEEMTDLTLLDFLKKTTIMARILPEHKLRIVSLLQSQREVVVVTGDGVNDVPALKAADLSIAMGSGTEAAKSVSKMVIADGNLHVIIDAIKNGRVIAANIRKVIYYLLSTGMQQIVLISTAILWGLPLPLSPIQILWINLVTDGVQDKTFPFAKEEGHVMDSKPRRPEKQFFDMKQMLRIGYFSLVTGIAGYGMYRYLLGIYSYELARTIIFTSIVTCQWFNGIQAQKEKDPFFWNIKKSFTTNPYIFIGVGLGLLLQLIAIYGFPRVFHAEYMSLIHWKYPLYFSLLAFGVVELRKWAEKLIHIVD